MSKIIERHMFRTFYDYLDQRKLISVYQSGFKKIHSCESSLFKIVQNWYDHLNMNKIVGTVFIDLRKRFDLVDHKLLLSKLKIYKVTGSTLRLFIVT